MAKADSVTHTFEPIFNNESKVLILGTFPSVKSREQQFYYGHPQNRFWKLLALLMEDEIPDTIPEKKDFLLRHRIAVWDVIHSCTIEGSSDSSIRDVVPNDISMIWKKHRSKQFLPMEERRTACMKICVSGLWHPCGKTAVHQSGKCCVFVRTSGSGVAGSA